MRHPLLKQTAHLLSRRSLSVLIITVVLLSANLVGLNLAVGQATLKNTKIAFDSKRDGNWDIYTMNRGGTDLIKFTNHPANDRDPAWSPDGTKIVFTSNRDGNWDIYTMNPDGTDPINLTNHPADDIDPSWSPDGARIAFVSLRDRKWGDHFDEEIYLMNADGTNPVQLTDNENRNTYPKWSPDGTKIAFNSVLHGNWKIYVMNPDGTNPVHLTNGCCFCWSPDGRQIAFEGDDDWENDAWDIYTMNIDEGDIVRLTYHPGPDSSPSWSPMASLTAVESKGKLITTWGAVKRSR